MISWLLSLESWNWFILGVLLLLIEVLAPGTFMMWLGLAAILVGLLSFVVDLPWQGEVVAFAVLALALIPAWRRFARKVEGSGDEPFLNRRAQGYVGRVFTLQNPIVDGRGTLNIDDTLWRVAGPDCAAGSHVRVTRVDGSTLIVEPG